MSLPERFLDLPGAELVAAGVGALWAGDVSDEDLSDEALLVAMASLRIRSLGIEIPDVIPPDAGDRLYERLAERHGDAAHARFNALTRRLDSFIAAATSLDGAARRSRDHQARPGRDARGAATG